MTEDWKKADAEKLLREALNRIYATPQEAFMDGSYKRVKEAIIFSIDKALSKGEEHTLATMEKHEIPYNEALKKLIVFREEKARQEGYEEAKNSLSVQNWLDKAKQEGREETNHSCDECGTGQHEAIFITKMCPACIKKVEQKGRDEQKGEHNHNGQIPCDCYDEGRAEERKRFLGLLDDGNLYDYAGDLIVSRLKQKLEESE